MLLTRKFIDPSSTMNLNTPEPNIKTFLFTTMNIITTKFDSTLTEQLEDTSCLLDIEKTLSSNQRKKWASKQTNRQSITFLKDKTYYFETCTKYLDVTNMSIKIPGMSLDMRWTLDGQPIKLGIQNKDGSETYCYVEIGCIELQNIMSKYDNTD